MKQRNGRIVGCLMLLGLVAAGLTAGCSHASGAEVEVTYYYLPG